MSKAPKRSEVELKNEELTFGVEEAVEVLVVKYLANVDSKVDAAETVLEDANEAYDVVADRVKESVDSKQYNHTSKTLGIKSRVADVTLDVNKTVEDSSVRVVLTLTDLDIVGSNYTGEFGKYRKLPITKRDHTKLIELRETINDANDELREVSALRNTSDVTRALRARVMTVKLKEAGIDISELLEDEDIAAIINI